MGGSRGEVGEREKRREKAFFFFFFLNIFFCFLQRKLDGVRIASCGFFESVTTKISRKRELNLFRKGIKSLSVDRLSLRSRNDFFIRIMQSRFVFI